jgi:hypothetical protein
VSETPRFKIVGCNVVRLGNARAFVKAVNELVKHGRRCKCECPCPEGERLKAACTRLERGLPRPFLSAVYNDALKRLRAA